MAAHSGVAQSKDEFSPATANAILERIATGETLKQILKTVGMPNRVTWGRWTQRRPDLALAYDRARISGFYAWADDIIEISDDAVPDWIVTNNKRAQEILRFNKPHVERARLMIDNRKWVMATLAGQLFGANKGGDRDGTNGPGALTNMSGRDLVQQVIVFGAAVGITIPQHVIDRMLVECGALDAGPIAPLEPPADAQDVDAPRLSSRLIDG